MSLAEALNDDILALEAGLFCLLPSRAALLSTWIHLGIRAKDTLRRACSVPYVCFEVACQENGNVSNAVVEVIWNESSSIFDHDKELHDKLLYYHDTSYPTRCAAMHLCCSSPFVARFLRPILRALRTKTSRARSVYHDVPNTEVIRTLTYYGITAEMLPVEMGGTLNFCQTDWIAQLRLTEIKEQEIE